MRFATKPGIRPVCLWVIVQLECFDHPFPNRDFYKSLSHYARFNVFRPAVLC